MILWRLTFDPATMAACRTCSLNSRLLNHGGNKELAVMQYLSKCPLVNPYVNTTVKGSVECRGKERWSHLSFTACYAVVGKSAMAVFCTQEQQGTKPSGSFRSYRCIWGRSIIKELQGTLWHKYSVSVCCFFEIPMYAKSLRFV